MCHTLVVEEVYASHSVFSVTKSLGAAVTLLRLVQQYGDQVADPA
jgi:hypothetical protein